jgi:hypothetical protein
MIAHVQSVQERGNTMAKRRTFKPEFKAWFVLEELSGVKSTVEICHEHQLKPQVFSRWKVELLGWRFCGYPMSIEGAEKN